MSHNIVPEQRCTGEDEGRPCVREAVMLAPVKLCEPHRIEVALAVIPGLLRDRLAEAHLGLVAPPPRTDLITAAGAADVATLLNGVHDSIVYFIANGGRVKIGYTTNLRSRLSSLTLRSDAVLLALHGGPELERALHAHFKAYRSGNTEWFELAPEVFRYIASPHPAEPGSAPVQQPLRAVAEPELLTTRQVADYYGVQPSTVGTWKDRGKITPAARDDIRGNLYDPATLPDLQTAGR